MPHTSQTIRQPARKFLWRGESAGPRRKVATKATARIALRKLAGCHRAFIAMRGESVQRVRAQAAPALAPIRCAKPTNASITISARTNFAPVRCAKPTKAVIAAPDPFPIR